MKILISNQLSIWQHSLGFRQKHGGNYSSAARTEFLSQGHSPRTMSYSSPRKRTGGGARGRALSIANVNLHAYAPRGTRPHHPGGANPLFNVGLFWGSSLITRLLSPRRENNSNTQTLHAFYDFWEKPTP